MALARIATEIEAEIYAIGVPTDYGVPRSSTWVEYDDLELHGLTMFGREWTEKELRNTFGDQGADALIALIFDQVEDWEE
jgi:hypothetical protein